MKNQERTFDIVCHQCGNKDCQLYIIKKITEHKNKEITRNYWIEIKCLQCDKILEKEIIENDD